MRSSHPVEVPIQSSTDIDQVFDHISYLKGVPNERVNWSEDFLKRCFKLKNHSFSNATTNDLLSSISEMSIWIILVIAGVVKFSHILKLSQLEELMMLSWLEIVYFK